MKAGWELEPWNNVLEIRSGRNQKGVLDPNGQYPIIGSAGKIMGYANNYLCDEGTTIVGRKGTINNPLLIDTKFWNVDTAFGLIAGDRLNNKFLYYFCRGFNFEKFNKGTTLPSLVKKDLINIQIPIPPLEEQKSIVTVLDKAFSAIDQAKANIDRNIINAKELFQSKLNEIFSQKGEGWEKKKLGEVCMVERGSSPRPIKKFLTQSEDGVHWVKIGDVNEGDKYVRETKQKITKEGAKKSRFVDIGDFILSNSMSFGRPYIMDIQGYIHDGWFVLRLPKNINADYFWQLLASPYLKEQFNSLAAGAIVKNISGDLVKKALVPIPSIEEQEKIFLETEKIKMQTSNLIELYEHELNNLEEFKKSILQKAFAGELT